MANESDAMRLLNPADDSDLLRLYVDFAIGDFLVSGEIHLLEAPRVGERVSVLSTNEFPHLELTVDGVNWIDRMDAAFVTCVFTPMTPREKLPHSAEFIEAWMASLGYKVEPLPR